MDGSNESRKAKVSRAQNGKRKCRSDGESHFSQSCMQGQRHKPGTVWLLLLLGVPESHLQGDKTGNVTDDGRWHGAGMSGGHTERRDAAGTERRAVNTYRD